MNKYDRGSEWRKWDLHVHTKGTNKNDNFKSPSFEKFCVIFFKMALEKDIQAIGITDYFNIDNFKNIKEFVDGIDSHNEFDEKEKNSIKNIFLFPNVELRILPATGRGRLINIHCLFNPDENFLDKLENNFFASLEDSDGHKMNRAGFVNLGKSCDGNLNDDGALKKGIEEFHLEPSKLISLFRDKQELKENTIIAVSNSSNDGASGLQEHYKLFENEPGSLDAVRSNIYKLSGAIFSANPADKEFFLGKKNGRNEQFIIEKFGSLKPCIHGSDAHREENLFNPDKNRYCWIKADLTFEGLKQIIYEPEERVCIGEKPSILDKVENNKTNYIKSLEINQANKNHTGDIWFKDISIPFNNELIAIIGNKGSGKSSIADILGLVGDTRINKKYFSFLNKNKFLKSKLADKFTAKITWESDGVSSDIPLGADSKIKNPESVRFIPQNYFEELTNELEINKFQDVLENIIFEYIPTSEKLSQSDFKELEAYKAKNVNKAIQDQENKIQNINKEIINLEKKKHPDYLQRIEGQIARKKIEIKEQNKLLKELPNIPNPNPNNNKDSDSEQQNKIAQYNSNLDTLNQSLADKKQEKSVLVGKIETLKQLKQKIEFQQKSVKEFLQNHKDEAKEQGLNINEILKIKVNFSPINKKIRSSEAELEKIDTFFEPIELIQKRGAEDNNKSIIYKIALLSEKLKSEIDKLKGKEKEYQKNEQQKKSINEKIQELQGNPNNPSHDSLEFYKKEKEFITKSLNSLLEETRTKRIKISLEIFKKKSELIELYNSFKKSVDDKISQNRETLEDYDIKIDSSFNLALSFYSDFLAYINQRKIGCFRGSEEGRSKIRSIVEDSGFSDEGNIKDLLTAIISALEKDGAAISEQVNEDKLSSFYDYVFSLDYLSPKYELKLSGKALDQLSPGERGALLLIFYLMIDKGKIPLVIDQPEDNLDNETVYKMLSKFIKKSKKNRQIVIVTHNPNLAVGADAEQIIHVSIDKTNKNKFSFISGSIENSEINDKIVQILEGTKPAFDKRRLKYQGQ